MSNYIKAYILEIKNDHLVLMTADGRFLRYDISAGSYEIGDEMLINNFKLESQEPDSSENNRNVFKILRGIAIGFTSIAVLVTGLYFGINYFNKAFPGSSINVAKADAEVFSASQDASEEINAESIEETELAQEAVPEDETKREESIVVGEESDEEEIILGEGTGDTAHAQPVLYEGNYQMDKFNEDLLVDYPDIKIGYRINDHDIKDSGSENGKNLILNFIAVKEKHIFNGNIDAILNNRELIITRTFSVIFENFEYGQERSEIILLEDVEKSFRIIVYGHFQEQQ